ncbi:hypothetical protein FBU30_006963 [Linnemannia zychae]|nr:hypothetical protein FBU30_006963 [Linnemannia zychae]
MGSSTTIIGGKYHVLGKIGEGSFGEVFRATHIATGVDYAIKREPINISHPQLEHEAKIYARLDGGDGIPHVHWFGKEGMYNAMVIDLLGPNLKQVRHENEKFPLSFVIELGVQIISHIEFIHKRGIVYRDIKPENFLLDADIILPDPPLGKMQTPPTYPDQSMSFFNDTRRRQNSLESNLSTSPGSPKIQYDKPHVSMVDFGLAAFYRDASGKHIPNRGSTPHKIGTARYASINIHCGRQHTRRDDIESIGYMLIEFLIGTLPWSGIMARNSKQGWSKMKEIKEEIELDELCEGLPKGFMTYIGYARSLKFEEEPDYDYLRNILRGSAGRGSEAQTVRCHRDSVTHMSRSLEQCFEGLHINRTHEPIRSKASCRPENPLKNWRSRREYVPPQKDEYSEYNPNLMWTTTPPDPSGMAVMGPRDIHHELKDKIEWDPSPSSPQAMESNLMFEGFGELQDNMSRTTGSDQKQSWGEDDPIVRWGQEDDSGSNSGGEILSSFHIGSFQDEMTPVPSKEKVLSERLIASSQPQAQALGHNHTPQDARFYLNEPPEWTPTINGAKLGQSYPSVSQPIPSSDRKTVNQQLVNMPPHPLVKDPTSGSPKSLSSSLSSLGIRSGSEEEPGIERSQASANRIHTQECFSLDKPIQRKHQGLPEKVNGSMDRHELGWGPFRSSGGNGGHGGDYGHGFGQGGQYSHHNGRSGRNGSENWQHSYPRDHGSRQQDRWRSDRRPQASSVEPPVHFPDFYQHQQQHPSSSVHGNQRNHQHHARQNSAPGVRAHQHHHSASTSKQSLPFPHHSQTHSQSHGYGHGPNYGPGQGFQDQNLSQGVGYSDRRRRSRSRKCSNASLSSLSDHRGNNGHNGNSNNNNSNNISNTSNNNVAPVANNKFGNGNTNINMNFGRIKSK